MSERRRVPDDGVACITCQQPICPVEAQLRGCAQNDPSAIRRRGCCADALARGGLRSELRNVLECSGLLTIAGQAVQPDRSLPPLCDEVQLTVQEEEGLRIRGPVGVAGPPRCPPSPRSTRPRLARGRPAHRIRRRRRSRLRYRSHCASRRQQGSGARAPVHWSHVQHPVTLRSPRPCTRPGRTHTQCHLFLQWPLRRARSVRVSPARRLPSPPAPPPALLPRPSFY